MLLGKMNRKASRIDFLPARIYPVRGSYSSEALSARAFSLSVRGLPSIPILKVVLGCFAVLQGWE